MGATLTCPNCGVVDKVRVRACSECGEAFASDDLLELQQLEYLVQEAASGLGAAESAVRPYHERLDALRARMLRREQVSAVEQVQPQLEPSPAPKPAPAKPTPPKERVPFDQWLLSERNIKFALYGGGLLLVLAGLIFIGVNWTRIPGPGKFAITLLITGTMYLGGYLLIQRPAQRSGGIALLAVASGFLAINFAVLQIYVFGPRGLPAEVMWLLASPLCLIAYAITTIWARSKLFVLISLAAAISSLSALLVLVQARPLTYTLVYSLLPPSMIGLSRLALRHPRTDFATQTLFVASQVLMPVIVLAALVGWIGSGVCPSCELGSPWLAITTLAIGTLFYAATDVITGWNPSRWIAAVMLPVLVTVILAEVDVSDLVVGITLMVIALAYLGGGYALVQREHAKSAGLPLYVTAYAIALLVTAMASGDAIDFAAVLFADVLLLAISAVVHHDYRWIYAAAWTAMLPVYLVIANNVTDVVNQGLLMGLLGLNYVAIGFVVGRSRLEYSWPFLSAAAFLTVVVPAMVWEDLVLATVVLSIIAVVYFLVSVWLAWSWLLVPSFLAINLAVIAVNLSRSVPFLELQTSLTLSIAILGVIFATAGVLVRRVAEEKWIWPLYLFAAIDLGAAYLSSLLLDSAYAVAMSLLLTLILLSFAWLERRQLVRLRQIPVLSYAAFVVVFVGSFLVLDLFETDFAVLWPIVTAGVCALFVMISWLIRPSPLREIYGIPLLYTGLVLMLLPIVGSFTVSDPALVAAVFAICGLAIGVTGAIRRNLMMIYAGIGAVIVVMWAVLLTFEVAEPQAYVLPLGLSLLGIGWNERRLGHRPAYEWVTSIGLLILLGSTLFQSLQSGDYIYALLLLIESLIALGIGIWKRSRSYVRLGALGLLINVIVELGPSFAELPRWIQLGATGALLLGGGLAALFKREEILKAQRRMRSGWKEWSP